MGRLDGSVAIITGAARGQGAAEAALFVREGARVILTDVLDLEGEQTAGAIGPQARYAHLDVTSEDGWAALVADVLRVEERIDVLVNNAGIFRIAPMTTTSLSDFTMMMDINCVGVFLGMRSVSAAMIAQGSGSIVNISSIAGLQGSGISFAYSTSKWAVRGMTKAAAVELARHGVRCNSVHPGIIDTAMLGEFDSIGIRENLRTRIPLGREAHPNEVGNMVLFLASQESSYCTGSEFVVDGGWTA